MGEDDALLGDGLSDLDHELEARFAELERQADLAEATTRAYAPPRPAAAPSAPHPAADDPLRDLKAAFSAQAAPKPAPEVPPVEVLLVLCPSPACGRKNRVERARALATDAPPRCGACGASLVTHR